MTFPNDVELGFLFGHGSIRNVGVAFANHNPNRKRRAADFGYEKSPGFSAGANSVHRFKTCAILTFASVDHRLSMSIATENYQQVRNHPGSTLVVEFNNLLT